jgi:hypothetical protein
MSFFSFTKSENRRAEQVLPGGWLVPVGREEAVGKGCERVSIVQRLCTHVCKWKIRPVETIPGIREGSNKGEWWRE